MTPEVPHSTHTSHVRERGLQLPRLSSPKSASTWSARHQKKGCGDTARANQALTPFRIALIALITLITTMTVPLPAEEIRLLPAADTGLFELDPDFNFGGQHEVVAGTLGDQGDHKRARSLVHFDLTGAVPAGARPTAAQLHIYVAAAPPDGSRRTTSFHLHRMLVPWVEGVQKGDIPGGAMAEAGETTWNHRIRPDTPWGSPGGKAGVDFAQSSSGERRLSVSRETYTFQLNDQGLADLRGWLQDPTANFGWILIAEDEERPFTARRLGSRENLAETRRPVLTIQFDPMSEEAPELTFTQPNPFILRLTFPSTEGAAYQLLHTESVSPPSWRPLGAPIPGSGKPVNIDLLIAPQRPTVFYRIRTNP